MARRKTSTDGARASPRASGGTPARGRRAAPAEAGGRAAPSSGPSWQSQLLAALWSLKIELAGLALVVAGLLTLLALFGLTEGSFITPWAGLVRQVFGYGSYLVALALSAAGLALLWLSLRGQVRISWLRIIGAEIAFAAVLGLLHLLSGDPQPLALALSGGGGGIIGWALFELLVPTLGSLVAGLLLALALVVGIGLTSGIQWADLRSGLDRTVGAIPVQANPADEAAGKAEPATRSKQSESLLPASRARSPRVSLPRPAALRKPGAEPGITSSAARSPGSTASPQPVDPATTPPVARVAPGADSKTRPVAAAKAGERKSKPLRLPERPAPLDLLDAPIPMTLSPEEADQKARVIIETLNYFGVPVEQGPIQQGPAVTMFGVIPGYIHKTLPDGQPFDQKVRVSQITALASDLAMALASPRIRMQAPVPGQPYVGIEVPNGIISLVNVRTVMESDRFERIRAKSPLAIALGVDVSGQPVAADLAAMPHLLIAGTTGSGKSVCISALTTCLVMNNAPDDLRLVMVDPKMVELVRFNGLPHLFGKVEVELERILAVLHWATREMDRRYQVFSGVGARNLVDYRKLAGREPGAEPLPYIVVVIDELADLMMMAPEDTERTLCRLAQMARATGIHLVVATQRPSTDVVTGLIKANFPARISFAVASSTDSRVILDTTGAEALLGRGDMLFLTPDAPGPKRVQGALVTDAEMARLVEHWKKETADRPVAPAPWEDLVRELANGGASDDELLQRAIALVQQTHSASASLLQRRLRIGFPRAARLMDELESRGIIGAADSGGRTREVYRDQDRSEDEL